MSAFGHITQYASLCTSHSSSVCLSLCVWGAGNQTHHYRSKVKQNLCSWPTHICLTPILYPVLLSSLPGPPCKVTSWAKVLRSLFFWCSGSSLNYLNDSPFCWLNRSSSQSVLPLWLFVSSCLNLHFFKLKSQFTSSPTALRETALQPHKQVT